jgi:hypothetical protein
MPILVLLTTAFTLGLVHAFDPDHVVAVSAFISKEPKPHWALRFALRWGLGHALPLLLMGGGSVWLGQSLPASFGYYMELGVGVTLVLLGLWLLQDILREIIHLHPHRHGLVEHSHFHSHLQQKGHLHKHSVFLIGILHGGAGTASVVVLIPMTVISSPLLALGYLLAFSLAVLLAMVLYGLFLGSLARRFIHHQATFLPIFKGSTALLSLSLGCLWILRSL